MKNIETAKKLKGQQITWKLSKYAENQTGGKMPPRLI